MGTSRASQSSCVSLSEQSGSEMEEHFYEKWPTVDECSFCLLFMLSPSCPRLCPGSYGTVQVLASSFFPGTCLFQRSLRPKVECGQSRRGSPAFLELLMVVAPEPCGLPGPLLWALEAAPQHGRPLPGSFLSRVCTQSPHLECLVLHGCRCGCTLWSWQGGAYLVSLGERNAVHVCMSSVSFQRDRHLTGFSGKSCQAKAQLSILRSEFS